ncbi:O-antigen ligase family protein [Muricauda sp. NFXS6]|uniref:O-antigen ligase family protein n=1 Tax=Allomuricauda sp. NFXS6 TaxID=2819094 RepID=UPI0032DEABD7
MLYQFKVNREKLHARLLYAIIFIPLFVDALNGMFELVQFDFSIGRLFRGLLWFFGLLFLLAKKGLSFVEIFIPLWLIHVIVWYFSDEKFDFLMELSFLLKATYFFVIYGVLAKIWQENKKKYIIKYLKLYFKAASGLICFSFFTNIGTSAYNGWGFGTKSFFLAANDIGITILLLFTFFLFNRKSYKIHWAWIFIGYLSLILLGTTTGMIASTVVVIFYALVEFFLKKMGVLKRLVIVFISIIVVLVSSISIYRLVESTPYFVNKYEKILSKGIRSDVTKWSNQYFEERSTIKAMFGEGMSSFSKNFVSYAKGEKGKKTEEGAYVERDFHDFKGAYGLLLLLILIFAYGFLFLRIIVNLCNEQTIFYFSVVLIVLLVFLHGYFAGHVFYSPTVAGILASIFVLGVTNNPNRISSE